MALFYTTKSGTGRSSHKHIAYIPDNNIGAATSTVRKHNHTVIYDETEGTFNIGETDGHTHELVDSVFGSFEWEDKKQKEEDIVQDVRRFYKASEANEKDYRDASATAEDFYAGEHWKEEDKNRLGDDRPALTFNEIEAKVDILTGYQRRNRTDIKYLPIEGGDATVADILNVLTKVVLTNSNFEYEESESFEDATITGRGVYDCYIDYDDNTEGDIVIERMEWEDVRFGPYNKKDLRDLEYYTVSKIVSWDNIKSMFPDKKDEIQKEIDIYEEMYDKDGKSKIEPSTEKYDRGGVPIKLNMDHDFVNVGKKEYRVIELRRRETRKEYIAIKLEDNYYNRIGSVPKSVREEIETIPGVKVVGSIKKRIHSQTIAGGVLVDDRIDEIFDGMHSIVPMHAKKRKDRIWGKVKPLIDPQREENKRISQQADILNKVAVYGYFYDDDTFETEKDRKLFENNSSKPGFTQKVTNVDRPPLRAEGVKFPNELAAMASLSSEMMARISNVNDPLQGINRRAESGIAIIEQKQQGLLGNEYLFDNQSMAKRMLGRLLIKMYKSAYPADRIMRIIEHQNSKEEITLGGEPFSPHIPEEEAAGMNPQDLEALKKKMLEQKRNEIMDLLTNDDLTRYDVAVAESAYNPTTRHANFITWSEMARNGFPIDPVDLVNMSDVPEKDKMIKGVMKTLESQERARRETIEMELYKAGAGRENNPQ